MLLSVIAGKLGDKIYEYIPFILMAKNKEDGSIPLNIARIIEAVIIAVITGAIIGWSVNGRLDRLEAMVAKIYSDIYRPSIGGQP